MNQQIYQPGAKVFLMGTAIEATINCASIYAHGGVLYEMVWWSDGAIQSTWVSDFEISTSQPKKDIGFLKGDK